jgi:hypothetical protein
LKNENEVRGRDFEENLVLDRSFLFLSIVLRPPIVLVLVLVLGFSWVGAKISKIENPSAALAIPTWPHRECKPQEHRISTTS